MRQRAIACLLFAWCARAQVPELAHAARAFPAEFAAEAILRLAEAGRQPASWRAAQIAEAFQLAGAAREQVKRTVPAPAGEPRTLDAFTADLNLDALSLRTRAVTAMAALDGRKARELFESLTVPAIKAGVCASGGTPDVAAYYEALGVVVEAGFSSDERRKGQAAQLLMSVLQSLSSPLQVAPAARLIASAKLSDAEIQAATAALSGALPQISAEDSAFTAALYRDRLLDEIAALATNLERRGLPASWLAQNFRRFLIAQLKGPRCAPHVADAGAVLALRDAFNARFGVLATPLRDEDMVPERVEEPARAPERAESYTFSMRLRRLRLTSREDPEWKNQVREIIDDIQAWSPSGTSGSEVFHKKAGFFQALLELLPAGAERQAVTERYVGLVSRSGIRQSNPLGWYCHANVLASRLRSDRATDLLKEFEASGDGLLAFQAQVEKIAPQMNASCGEGTVCMSLSGPDAMRAELVAFLLN
jgi:hypothetical protein